MSMRVVLVGNPNSGKTTLFNALTGSSAKVGNWPGVTVEKKEGVILGNEDLYLYDLPGIYSLNPYTSEEKIASEILLNESFDCIINIVDASNLERNLYLTTQLIDLQKPMVIVLNRMDVFDSQNGSLDIEMLENQLGYPVIELIATKQKGIEKIVPLLRNCFHQKPRKFICFEKVIQGALFNIQNILECDYYTAIKFFERDIVAKDSQIEEIIVEVEELMGDDSLSLMASSRYNTIDRILCMTFKKTDQAQTVTDKIDRVVLNKWLALPIFFGLMALIYYISITSVGEMTIGWIEIMTTWFQTGVTSVLSQLGAHEVLIALVVDGIIGSIGAIFVFVPQIMILFFFISLLEDSGYMSRIAFMMDKIFNKLGLSGKSFIPMMIGTGCTTPGIMAARTIENIDEKELTILLTPFIPCGAKLPIYAMFLSLFFPKQGYLGALIYLIPFLVVIISGKLIQMIRRRKYGISPFIIELPEYSLPNMNSLLINLWEKVKGFVVKAGSIIFVSVVTLWVLQNFNIRLEYVESISDSILATLGEVMRFLFIPLGFGDHWAPSVAAMSGFAAKEVVVTTFASITQTTHVSFTQVAAFSFILFMTFSAPCVSALGTLFKELGSFKKTIKHIAFHTGVAYGISLIFYQIASRVLLNTSAMNPINLEFVHSAEISSDTSGLYLLVGLLILLGLYVVASRKVTKKNIIKGAFSDVD